MTWTDWIKRIVEPLRSRKVRVALATILGAYAGQAGLQLSEEVTLTIVSVGVALILGIAVEDNGRKRAKP